MNSSDTASTIRRALLLSGMSEQDAVSSMEGFRDFAAQVIRLAAPDCTVIRIGSSTLRMTEPTSKAVRTITLSRQFNQLDRTRPTEGLHPFVANLGPLVSARTDTRRESLEDRLGDVIPLLKSAEYAVGNAEVLRRQFVQSGKDAELHAKLSWEVNSRVTAFAVINDPHGYHFITGDQLSGTGLTETEIRDIAIQNVREAASTLPPSDYDKGSKEFNDLDGMASALILLPEFLENEAAQAGGPLCVLSGDADHLFIVPVANEEFLDYLLGRVANGSLRLPEMPPLVYQDGELHPAEIQKVSSSPSLFR